MTCHCCWQQTKVKKFVRIEGNWCQVCDMCYKQYCSELKERMGR